MKKLNSMILVVLISAGAISLAMAAVNEIPAIWSLVLPWLRPPYLHVVINVIIIAIAAASRSRQSQKAPPVRDPPPPAYYADYASSPEVREVVEVPEAASAAAAYYEREDRVVELKPVMVNGFEVGADAEEGGGEDSVDGNTLTYNIPSPERFSPEFQLEYFPPANPTRNILERESKTVEGASRATHELRHGGGLRPLPDRYRFNDRKSKSFKERSVGYDAPASRAEASPSRNNLTRRAEARSSARNSPPPQNPVGNIPPRFKEAEEEYETMESAWKKITEGASASRAAAAYVGPPPIGILRKSSSFKERGVHNDSASSSGLRREESPSQDELNRRVEAFIKKVNDEIRLQRQNSSNQYIQLNSAA